MSKSSRPARAVVASDGLAIEGHSIDYIPENERHAKLSSQGPFWFLGNFHFFTISIGFVGPSLGLSALWTMVAGALGIMLGTIFMAFHGSQGPEMGLPQMIQSRAQFGYRGVILALVATMFVFVGFNVVNISLIINGLKHVFGLNPTVVACGVVLIGALLSIFGHDLMHKAFKWALLATLPLYTLVTIALMMGVGHSDVAATALEKLLAFGRDRKPRPPPLTKAKPQPGFQGSQLRTDGGLRGVERRLCRRDAARLDHGEKHADQAQIQFRYSA